MFKGKLKCAALALLLAISNVPSYGQIRHEFEVMLGGSAAFREIDGDECSTVSVNPGLSFSTRYSFYAGRHVGAFAQFEAESWSGSEKHWFGAVNKADGEKYLYRFRNGYAAMNESCIGLFAGAAFRASCNGLDITTRLGAGVMMDGFDCSYERRSRDGSTGPEYYDIKLVDRRSISQDYLIESDEKEFVPSLFALKADVRFSMPHENRIGFLFVDLGADIPVGKVTREMTVTRSTLEHDPTNWVESVAWSDAGKNWIMDTAGVVTSQRVRLQPSVSISLGYCFTIKMRR